MRKKATKSRKRKSKKATTLEAKTAEKKKTLGTDARRPSQVTDSPWLFAERKKGDHHPWTSKCGKWLIFLNIDQADQFWPKIKKAIEDGKLGQSAKVGTRRRRRSVTVICVYTYDWTDQDDVMRVREQLRKIGIKNKIPYKSDEDTLKGRYHKMGHNGLSKYYE